jgi:hypothetical protein
MRAICIVALACACGDNAVIAPDAAPPGAPDLAIVPPAMDPTTITIDTFTPTACEVAEGCAMAGTRRLLRFDTITANVGTADLMLGPVPPPGVSSGLFVWSPCHMHHHILGFATFTLRDASGVVATGRKQGFCLEDDLQISPADTSHNYTCMFQGISVGWADVYDRSLPCQWIDVTDVPSGTYTLEVDIDPMRVLPDSNRSNNRWMTDVAL